MTGPNLEHVGREALTGAELAQERELLTLATSDGALTVGRDGRHVVVQLVAREAPHQPLAAALRADVAERFAAHLAALADRAREAATQSQEAPQEPTPAVDAALGATVLERLRSRGVHVRLGPDGALVTDPPTRRLSREVFQLLVDHQAELRAALKPVTDVTPQQEACFE